MGASTAAIGLLPGIDSIGVWAPILLVAIRVTQGFAMGGEYGGAAVYVAEHARADRRGWMTGWIQSTAAVGLLLALAAVAAVRFALGEREFQAWGWRIPFLLSTVLLMISLWIRLELSESPEFERLRRAAQTARAPLRVAFRGENLRRIVQALVCVLLAQGAVWYTGHFYAQFFLERVLKVDGRTVALLLMMAVLVSSAGYVLFGWLSDRIGRKPVMLIGMGVTLLAYFPGFHALTHVSNPALERAAREAPVVLHADPRTCRWQFDLLGRRAPSSACDVIRTSLADAGVPYRIDASLTGGEARAAIGTASPVQGDFDGLADGTREMEAHRLATSLRSALVSAGYPVSADAEAMNLPAMFGILLLFMLASTALYGPQAATLVELFPTSIRYTALSVPYNIGTGWVGGLLPVSAFALVAATGNIYSGLFYPLVFTAISFVGCWLWLPETAGRPLQSIGDAHAE
jgi:MFS family permease